MSHTPAASGSTPVARAIALAVGAAAIVGIVLLAFTWPAVTSEPRDLPVAVAGPEAAVAQVTGVVAAQAGEALAPTPVSDRAAAVEAIEQREVYGAIVLGSAPGEAPEVLIATAANPQVAQMLQAIAAQLGQRIGAAVTVTDVVPFDDADPRGAKISAAAFPLVLGGMAGAVIISVAIGTALPRVVALVAYAVAGGLLLAGILHAWFGGLHGSFWVNATAIGLTIVAISAPIVGLRSLLGMPGIGVGAVLMMLIANPISAAAIPVEFILAPWGAIGQWFPPGAGATLLRELSYFPDANTAFPWTVLAVWAAAGVLLTCIAAARESKVVDETEELATVG
ncbi:hypothetical protein M1M07_10995 [Rhodococcus sp. HM1]|uniref:hypothetical protein n=1 Tax=Rhodococcus sp. HM1 TaxID=2937759 RepID=UPI00200A74C7|nr:hypothetical protein [Rhodococcus sp. HM1]MCK8671643.1 hypothetical protein [Rhodococcus sp. HM1]